jgi:hypothetical protein
MVLARSANEFDTRKEDALLKSIRGLLWLLWGLGWVIVPLVFSQIHMSRMIPTVMFLALAGIFVVTWHKNALLRRIVRKFTGPPAAAAPASETAPRRRIDANASSSPSGPRQVRVEQQVRVHATDLNAGDALGQTELEREDSVSARGRAARRSR